MPRWKFPYDAYGVPSLEVRVQAKGGPQIELSGTVDSGASTTVLSVEDADPLWGQADFFATFGINFERPEFTLRY